MRSIVAWRRAAPVFPSPRVRGEGLAPEARGKRSGGEGAFQDSAHPDKPPHPDVAFGAARPLPARGERRFGSSFALAVLLALALPPAAQAQMRGHGGPVRSVAVTPDDTTAIWARSTNRPSCGRSRTGPPGRCCASMTAR